MHGRVKKDVVEPTPEEREKQREQVRTARALFGKLLALRKDRVYSQQTFDMTSKALQFHPEFPTLWGYRREILLSGALGGGGGGGGGVSSGEAKKDEAAKGEEKEEKEEEEEATKKEETKEGSLLRREILEDEIKLLEKALRRTQKVYSIWFHRKWTVEKLFELCEAQGDVAVAKEVLEVEMQLCNRLLEADERNFHCWNHRTYTMGLMQAFLARNKGRSDKAAPEEEAQKASAAQAETVPAEPAPADADSPPPPPTPTAAAPPTVNLGPPSSSSSPVELKDLLNMDLDLSKTLINRNFSNYSAWHLRTLLQLPSNQEEELVSINLSEELDWVQQGIYTEPNDQSVWLYHHWLTVEGRGSEQVQISHCALQDGAFLVVFSRAVSVKNSSDQVRVELSLEEGRKAILEGTLVALTRDSSVAWTRKLPANRRRWSHVWHLNVEDGSESSELLRTLSSSSPSSSSSSSSSSPKVAKLQVPILRLGTSRQVKPIEGEQILDYSGPVRTAGARGPEPSQLLSSLLPLPSLCKEHLSTLKTELERVEELLDMEPDCRFAMLARGRLLMALAIEGGLDALKKAEVEVAKIYQAVAELDAPRKGYYSQAAAMCTARLRVMEWLEQCEKASPSEAMQQHTPLDLSGIDLQHFPPSLVPPLLGLRSLNVSNANLRDFGALPMLRSLEELMASRNALVGDLAELKPLTRLAKTDVEGNLNLLEK